MREQFFTVKHELNYIPFFLLIQIIRITKNVPNLKKMTRQKSFRNVLVPWIILLKSRKNNREQRFESLLFSGLELQILLFCYYEPCI